MWLTVISFLPQIHLFNNCSNNKTAIQNIYRVMVNMVNVSSKSCIKQGLYPRKKLEGFNLWEMQEVEFV